MLAVIGIVNQEGRSIKSKKGARWDRHNTVTDMEQRMQTKKQKQDTQKTHWTCFGFGFEISLSLSV